MVASILATPPDSKLPAKMTPIGADDGAVGKQYASACGRLRLRPRVDCAPMALAMIAGDARTRVEMVEDDAITPLASPRAVGPSAACSCRLGAARVDHWRRLGPRPPYPVRSVARATRESAASLPDAINLGTRLCSSQWSACTPGRFQRSRMCRLCGRSSGAFDHLTYFVLL